MKIVESRSEVMTKYTPWSTQTKIEQITGKWKDRSKDNARASAFEDGNQAPDQLKPIQSNRETGSPATLEFLWECEAKFVYLALRDRQGTRNRILTLMKSNIPAQRLKFGHWRQPRWCMTVR